MSNEGGEKTPGASQPFTADHEAEALHLHIMTTLESVAATKAEMKWRRKAHEIRVCQINAEISRAQKLACTVAFRNVTVKAKWCTLRETVRRIRQTNAELELQLEAGGL
jgi:hypothetical protein